MSNQNSWTKRLESYRYSQDERLLAYKFEKELEEPFEKLMSMTDQKTMVLGPYDLTKEPWRPVAIKSLARKYGFKVTEKETETTSEYTVTKQKLSKQVLR